MGKASDKSMDGRESNHNKGYKQQNKNTDLDGVDEATSSFRRLNSIPTSTTEQNPRLAASTSSPSLLTGCADSDSHIGADIERHVQAHRVSLVRTSQATPLSPIPMSPVTPQTAPSFLNFTPPSSDSPPDSVFLTPAPLRPHNVPPERPSSAPSNYLEQISGTLLRLVGDHYLCSTCGRQLRTIGDQLTMETQINHITRTLSASHLHTSPED